MTNKRFFTRGKILIALIAFLLMAAVTGVLSTQFIGQAQAYAASETASVSTEMRATADMIDALDGASDYDLMRVHHEYGGVHTYIVPAAPAADDYNQEFMSVMAANDESADFRTITFGGRTYFIVNYVCSVCFKIDINKSLTV